MNNRLILLQKFLSKNNLDAVIVKKLENVYYFSGFTGTTGMLLITKKGEYLLTDFRYIEQANGEADAIRARAQAEADAIRLRGEALRQNPNVMELEAINKWNGQLPQYMT